MSSQILQAFFTPQTPKDSSSNQVFDLFSISKNQDKTQRSATAQHPNFTIDQEYKRSYNILDKTQTADTNPVFPMTPKINLSKKLLELSQRRVLESIEFLHSISIFSRWPRTELSKVLYMFKTKSFVKGQYAFKQNEIPSHVFIVTKGNFTITKSIAKEKEDKSQVFNNTIIKKFENKSPKKIVKVDLVVKGEKEILGAEEVMNGTKIRFFSCVCNTAIAEVLMVNAGDFANKLVRSDVKADEIQIILILCYGYTLA